MTNKQELHWAIDQMSEEQVRKLIQVVQVIQADPTRTDHPIDLMRYCGILQLTEHPLSYQDRIRNEWL